MFNNTTPFGSGAAPVVQTPAVTDPTTIFPGTTVTSNFTFIIVPPPPFPAPPRSIDLSPLKLIFAIIAIVAVPILAYALFFSVPCSSSRRRNSSSSEDSPQVTVDISPPIIDDRSVSTAPESEVELKKDTHSMEIWNECAVCLSVFVDGEGIQPLNACKHAFHVSCIENWLKEQNSCPICRADVVSVKQTEGNLNGNGSVT